jgi:hypothetical protein
MTDITSTRLTGLFTTMPGTAPRAGVIGGPAALDICALR